MYPPGSDIPESRLDEDPTKPDTETKQPPVGAVVEQYALDGGALKSVLCGVKTAN